jgi:hypothetical protein
MALVNPHRTYQDLRKRVAFDRVLARLALVAPDSWLLKGGVALEYRLDRARATSDIDVSSAIDFDHMFATLKSAAALELGDYFALRIGEFRMPVSGVNTVRFNIDVLYEGGKLFEHLKIDVGFEDPWMGEPEVLTGTAFLDFAEIAPATLRAIPSEQHFAEKLHAYTKDFGPLGSTRVKDLVDMVLLLGGNHVDLAQLPSILGAVFAARGTHNLPAVLPPPPIAWSGSYAKLASGLPVPATCDEAYRQVANILAPILANTTRLKGPVTNEPAPKER